MERKEIVRISMNVRLEITPVMIMPNALIPNQDLLANAIKVMKATERKDIVTTSMNVRRVNIIVISMQNAKTQTVVSNASARMVIEVNNTSNNIIFVKIP